MNDLIHFAMERACLLFDGRGTDKVFNSACFSQAFALVSGVNTPLDGWTVRAMMVGRTDVESLSGGAHWRMKD